MPAPNAPMPLSNQTVGSGTLVFPSDLLSYTSTPSDVTGSSSAVASGDNQYSNSSGGYYSQFQFVSADTILPADRTSSMGMVGSTSFGNGGNIYLPLPQKIQDVQLNLWNDVAFIDYIPSLAGAVVGALGQSLSVTANPFMWMLYKQPLFKEWVFQWVLAPNSPDESSALLQILYAFKTAQLPAYQANALLYPYLVYVRLNPNQYMMDFKPCAIISVEIDFTGSGHGPAFFNTGAPTMVSFTVHLKEVQIQVRSDVSGRGGTFSSGMVSTG
jgi:hypothetical protein